jgi:hypothetical protein
VGTDIALLVKDTTGKSTKDLRNIIGNWRKFLLIPSYLIETD